ncbi:hypothetical protein RRF57_010685 [Xylaria bambusicola]|uniref:Carrier domain-containing protein n=1 Tax=Xylaria bambusicola TaxID=326684 RepID=A0AAN7ZD58_9PEZI
MGDLFEPHLLKPGLWRFRARADDIISFTTAEKLNPFTMESTIRANPLVKSAIIGGQGQFQASLLLEPREYPRNAQEEDAFLDAVWPSIVQANRGCPAHGRIMRGFVMLTNPMKPLPRASKDTVQRHAVLKLYEEEWRSLYKRLSPIDKSSKQPSDRRQHHLEPLYSTNERDGFKYLDEKTTVLIESIVEKKLSAALSQFTSAIVAAANQLRSIKSPDSDPLSQETGDVHQLRKAAASTAVSISINPAYTEKTIGLTDGANDDTKKLVDERLRQIIYDTLAENIDLNGFTDDTDLFKFGLDSLQVTSLLGAINAFIVRSGQPLDFIKSEAIYANPTMSKLLKLILND